MFGRLGQSGRMERGVDGLTMETLRSSREEWWDAEFTRTLLDAMPESAGLLLEIGAGLGRAAHELLPRRPGLRYIGVDLDGQRLAAAQSDLRASPWGERVQWLRAAGERLPVADGRVDVVLTSMTLQHVLDVGVVLREAWRALTPGGVFVAAEPDMLGHRFYFDGFLEGVTAAFAALYANRRAARLPADMTVGPRVPSLARAAGFKEVMARLVCVQNSRYRAVGEAAGDLLEAVDLIGATGAAPCEAEVEACRTAIEHWVRAAGAETLGQTAWLVPVMITHAEKSRRAPA